MENVVAECCGGECCGGVLWWRMLETIDIPDASSLLLLSVEKMCFFVDFFVFVIVLSTSLLLLSFSGLY